MADALKDIEEALTLQPDASSFYRTRAIIRDARGESALAQSDREKHQRLRKKEEEKDE